MARILVGCSDIAGFQSRAARALAEAGHEVRLVNVAPHKFNPELVDHPRLVRCHSRAFHFTSRLRKKGGIGRLVGDCLSVVLKWWVVLASLPRTEVYVFAGRRAFFSNCLDYRLLRLFRKRIVHVFLGADSRPTYLGGIEWAAAGTLDRKKTARIARRTRRQHRRVQLISRLVDEVVENPLCSHFQPRPCVNWFRVGFPVSAEAFRVDERLKEVEEQGGSHAVRILHCPSKLAIKGTFAIEECIERLKQEGHAIDYVRIANMPHSEVLAELARCDFVIDQLYSDTPLAGFASEAAIFGKPAVVGGHGWHLVEDAGLDEWVPPSARCDPGELDETVKRLLLDGEYRRELGAAARAFVEERWNEAAFGERFSAVIKGEIPEEWKFDPLSINYVAGTGMPLERRRELLRAFLRDNGAGSLKLDRRPALRDAIVAFAAEGGETGSPGG